MDRSVGGKMFRGDSGGVDNGYVPEVGSGGCGEVVG